MIQRIAYLLQKCKDNALSADEQQELADFFADETHRDIFMQAATMLPDDGTDEWKAPGNGAITDKKSAFDDSSSITQEQTDKWEPLLSDIMNADKTGIPVRKLRIARWWYAAAAVAAGIVVVLSLPHLLPQQDSGRQKGMFTDIPAGGNKALLQLANGHTVVLDDAGNGLIGQQGSVKIIKNAGGQLTYQVTGTGTADTTWNTLSTPRGGQFSVILPDGSKVWLNAASRLKFPAAFSYGTRRVELEGEGYFEVAAAPDRPFIVHAKGADIMVLGTVFNVNAYTDEASCVTTLLNGKVKVSGGSFSGLLQPGEQAVLHNGNGYISAAADAESTIAWKNGLFSFEHADIGTVMRQLARWYDVEVIFENKQEPRAFVGEIPRQVSLSKALDILRMNGISFTVEGRTIRVKDEL